MEYIDIKNGYTKKDIKKVSDAIEVGKIVILPTDTVYGISTNPFDENAVKKIYDIKGRSLSKPCNILVSDIEMIKQVVIKVSKIEEKIVEEFLPGALTIIFNKNNTISDTVTAGLNTVGVRIPDNKFILELIKKIGKPILATSLNLAGEKAKTNVNNLPNHIKENIDLIVDDGEAKLKEASTIIKVENDEIKILREGPITKEMLENKIKEKE